MGELLLTVALVTMFQAGKPVGTATGFFYIDESQRIYFVTNRHVVIDETKGMKADFLRVRLHTDANDLTKNVERDIPLIVNGRQRWHVHKAYPSPPIDIAVVELDQASFTTGVVIKALSKGNFLPDKFLMNPGEDVMVIGFPRGISDSTHNLPLVRNALVSSAYGLDFNGTPTFLVDANLHPGMSGSPVLTKPKNVWSDRDGNTNMLTGSPVYLLGVFSATLSLKQEALGLGQVWYGRLIEDILRSLKPAA